MPKTDEIQQLVIDAEKNGYTNLHVEYDGPNGGPMIKFKRLQGKKPDIEARMAALKPQLVVRLDPTPTKTRARTAKSASLPWLGRLNKAVNSAVEPDPAKHPWLHELYPESASGKALGAIPALVGATVGLPETLAGGAALGALTSVGTGYAAGEINSPLDTAESAASGILSVAGPQALGKIPGMMELMRGRHTLIADLDAKAENEYIEKALGLSSLSKMMKRGRSWVAGLRDARTQNEAWERMLKANNDIFDGLQNKVADRVEEMKQAFRKKWGLDANGRLPLAARGQMKTNKAMMDEFHGLTEQVKRLQAIPKQFRQNLTKLKSLGKQGWDKGAFRDSKTAVDAVESYDDIMDGMKKMLSGKTENLPFDDPSLLQRFTESRKEYSHFAAFRDLADNPKMLTTDPSGSGLPSGKLNNRELQLMMRDEPRNYQTRLGDLWDDFKTVVNRGELDPERVDVQANVPSLRNVSGHIGTGNARGFVRNAIPLRGKYVGNQANRLPKLFSDAAKTRELLHAPTPLIIGGAATGGKMKDIVAENPDASGQ